MDGETAAAAPVTAGSGLVLSAGSGTSGWLDRLGGSVANVTSGVASSAGFCSSGVMVSLDGKTRRWRVEHCRVSEIGSHTGL